MKNDPLPNHLLRLASIKDELLDNFSMFARELLCQTYWGILDEVSCLSEDYRLEIFQLSLEISLNLRHRFANKVVVVLRNCLALWFVRSLQWAWALFFHVGRHFRIWVTDKFLNPRSSWAAQVSRNLATLTDTKEVSRLWASWVLLGRTSNMSNFRSKQPSWPARVGWLA